jgi:hypothetical protein
MSTPTENIIKRAPTWADTPRPKFETPQADLPVVNSPHATDDQPESPSLGHRYVPGSANGDQA